MTKKYRTKECDQFISHDLVWTQDEIMNFFEEVPEVAEIEPLELNEVGKLYSYPTAAKINELIDAVNKLLKEKHA